MRTITLTTLVLCMACGPSVGGGDEPAGTTGEGSSDEGQSGASQSESDGAADVDSDGGTTSADDTTTAPADDCNFDKLIPDYRVLQEDVIHRTCSPFDNVCHSNKEYPDLESDLSLIELVGAPCNLGEGPEGIADFCELVPDRVQITGDDEAGVWETDVAWHMHDEAADMMTIFFREPLPFEPGPLPSLAVAAPGEDWHAIASPIIVMQDANVLFVQYFNSMPTADRERLHGLADGDPNGNGIYGGEGDSYLEIAPGDPAASYLMLRLLGEVPGAPMPLANEPVTDDELLALACWIEGTDSPEGLDPDALIDYASCESASAYCD